MGLKRLGLRVLRDLGLSVYGDQLSCSIYGVMELGIRVFDEVYIGSGAWGLAPALKRQDFRQNG